MKKVKNVKCTNIIKCKRIYIVLILFFSVLFSLKKDRRTLQTLAWINFCILKNIKLAILFVDSRNIYLSLIKISKTEITYYSAHTRLIIENRY